MASFQERCSQFFDEADVDQSGSLSKLELCKVCLKSGCKKEVAEIAVSQNKNLLSVISFRLPFTLQTYISSAGLFSEVTVFTTTTTTTTASFRDDRVQLTGPNTQVLTNRHHHHHHRHLVLT